MKKWILVLLAGVVLVAAAATVFWPRSEDDSLAVPERVCSDVFAGGEIIPLLQGGSGDLESTTIRGFPGNRERSSTPVCELGVKGRSVAFRVEYPSYRENLRELKKERAYVAQLGIAYGGYNKISGTIILEIPCPTRENSETSLFLNVGASMAREGEKDGRAKLADLTGYAARTLARKVYKCEGAEELPEGPVVITKGEGRR
ncbi:hypothetical protein [Streptomyces sp. NPDC006784]|uniref:hypothetical protein n=1 Tax=Streptomyces sp. NPDC006784 TaxID=3364764 RepID=UPI0036B31773